MGKKTNKKLQKHHLDATSGGLIGGFNVLPKGWQLFKKDRNDEVVKKAGIEAAAKAGATAALLGDNVNKAAHEAANIAEKNAAKRKTFYANW